MLAWYKYNATGPQNIRLASNCFESMFDGQSCKGLYKIKSLCRSGDHRRRPESESLPIF